MEVLAMDMAIREHGADAVKAAIDKLRQTFLGLTKDAKAADNQIESVGKSVTASATQWIAGAVGIGTLITGLTRMVTETTDAEYATAQLNAVLKSTKSIAGQTAEAITANSAALQLMSIYDDDAITSAQALLLTFTKIQGDTFPKATQAILDVATAMQTDLRSAAIQVGKALNDPILGVTALSRAGIQFTDAQKEMIKELVESNRLLDAQKIILGELETQFGGSAEAARNTFGGALRALSNDIGNALTLTGSGTNIGVSILNYLGTVVRGLRTAFDNAVLMFKALYVNATGVYKILKAMENPGTYAEVYKATMQEMTDATNAFLYATGLAKEPPIAKIADHVGKSFGEWLGATTTLTKGLTVSSGALGMFTSEALRVYPAAIAAATGITTVGDAADETAKKIDRLKKPVMAPWTRVVDEVAPINPKELFGLNTSMWEQPLDAFAERAHQKLREISLGLRNIVLLEFGALFGDAFATAIETAISQKSIGAGFKALAGTLLAGLGDMMVRFGAAALQAAILTNAFFKSLANNPATAIPAALAIIAVGASLKAAAAGIFSGMNKGAAGSVSGGGGYGGGSGGSITLPRVSFGATTAGAASGLSPVAPISMTIIGPNDPVAQRAMQELMTKANRRGAV